MATAAAIFATQFVKKDAQEEKVRVVVEPKIIKEEVAKVDILVARQAIPIGTALDAGLLDRKPWPQHLVLEDFIVSDGKGDAGIMGLVTRTPFQAGEPVIRSKLANPNDPSFLAANLGKGMRAVTIPVDAISGGAGFVYPGDKVDVLITQRVTLAVADPLIPGSKDKQESFTEVLVSNVKVIGVDQRAVSNAGEAPTPPSTFTLEVTQADAQKLRLAEKNAMLSVALRSMADKDEMTMIPPTGIPDLSRITPPTYFPMLYSSGQGYAADTVNLFGDDQPTQGGATKELDIRKKLESMAARKTALTGGEAVGSSESVVVLRGVKKETVGVERP
ncbi:MAG: Flp pilus assembly protein CpaB [Alphaproteobacteria bacterium]|nr:Flp pilus assembly protein CpaB [Alphaproteobacteria bacterium]